MEVGSVYFPDFHQIAVGQNARRFEDIFLFIDTQFSGQHAPVVRGHFLGGLQPDDIGEFPVPERRLDHCQQIIGLFFPSIGNGVSGHSEILVAVNVQAREKFIEIVGNQLFESDVEMFAADLDETWYANPERYLDAVQKLVVGARFAGSYQNIERQVGDEWKRMCRIDTLGSQQRIDLTPEIVVHLFFLGCRQFRVAAKTDILLFEQFSQVVGDLALLRQNFLGHLIAGIDLLLGQHSVNGQLFYPGSHLLLQTADTFHEELVQIGTHHGDEKHPLEQGHLIVCRFVKDPFVEGQPG